MYRYDKASKQVSIPCKICKHDLEFKIPEDFLEDKNYFPAPFRYVHGKPMHSVTIYLDKQYNIRGTEFGDSLSISSEIVRNLVEKNNMNLNSENSVFLRTMVNSFTTVLNVFTPDRNKILFRVGVILGENYESMFEAEDELTLLKSLGEFWKRNDFGRVENIEKDGEKIKFSVFDCFECRDFPNIGETICKMDEGFFKGILEKKFKKVYNVEEIGCLASGESCCQFEISIL
jgi:predicted hydrocarbon binding protein